MLKSNHLSTKNRDSGRTTVVSVVIMALRHRTMGETAMPRAHSVCLAYAATPRGDRIPCKGRRDQRPFGAVAVLSNVITPPTSLGSPVAFYGRLDKAGRP
ncbi:hypothetical protein [Sorangium sp. So ce1153]|uniref:hypothetical protein n=1 Tax=Sorangium sp. So ce1153 TaxID=3133333 RepID=UPI003F6146D7